MPITSLKTKIDIKEEITKEIIIKWNQVIVDLFNNHIVSTKNISAVISEKYKMSRNYNKVFNLINKDFIRDLNILSNELFEKNKDLLWVNKKNK